MASVQSSLQHPRRVFTARASTAQDRQFPWIISIVCLPDNRLLLTDWSNDMVKVMEMDPPHSVCASLANVSVKPWRLALLPDGLVAMTTMEAVIYLLMVSSNTVTVTSRINTAKQYSGIHGLADGHLLVSCLRSTGTAAVEVLTRQGDPDRTIVDTSHLPTLELPYYLCGGGDNNSHVLVSDCASNEVSRVCVSSGQVSKVFRHVDMKSPRQVCTDSAGRMYVASQDGHCVMVKDTDDQWRQVLTAAQHSDPGFVSPWALCLTGAGHLVVTWGKPDDRGDNECMVTCYQFT